MTKFFEFGHICQLVDSLPYKEEAVGSSPSMPTRSIADLRLRNADLIEMSDKSDIRNPTSEIDTRSRSSVG